MRRVVVTGLGAITPIGNNLHEYWEGLINGVSGSTMITRFNTENFKTRFACELKNYDSSKYFDRKDANKLDLYSQYAHIASDEAIVQSGLELDRIDKDRVGVIWASGIGGLDTFYKAIKSFVEDVILHYATKFYFFVQTENVLMYLFMYFYVFIYPWN